MQDLEFIGNSIEGGIETIKLQQADGTIFQDNSFRNTVTMRFADTNNTVMIGNTGLNDTEVEVKIRDAACFDIVSDPEFIPVCG